MNLRKTVHALLAALAVFGISSSAFAHGGSVARKERTELNNPSRQRIVLRKLSLGHQSLGARIDKPAVKRAPTRKLTIRRVSKKGGRPTPAEAGRAPNF